ncbi:hypothetical protein A0H81_02190 [Grifola frondosa]|uniref:CxC2-like cysteine cluster KDZ transposase-associated domain-containing protein n=1 Tax=Grifola frondosa TaxID=5627 RepID=A0A1C7MLL0_GRIFR|nr:hypothetical protein A0H81_02190 [Grifola frondosa]
MLINLGIIDSISLHLAQMPFIPSPSLKGLFTRFADTMPRRRRSNFEFYTVPDDNNIDAPPSTPATIHRHTDYAVAASKVSTRTTFYQMPPSPKRSRLSLATASPTVVDDLEYATSEPLDLDYVNHCLQLEEEDFIPRRRTAGDRPLLEWLPHRDAYLSELLRLEGRGDFTSEDCPTCAAGRAIYRCMDCQDQSLSCAACMVTLHEWIPLHRIQKWVGTYFERVSLKALGLRIQLGHHVGEECLFPIPAFGNDFVVLDISGVHEVSVNYCGCETALNPVTQLLRYRWYPATTANPKTAATFSLLELFHLLSTQSKVSGFEFYITLTRRTDNTGVVPGKGALAIQEALLPREGECAVLCPACPQPGKNLPEDWATAPPEQAWLYSLFIGLDANFRLKRKKVSSDAVDPGLSHGYAYFVEDTAYKKHLATYSDLIPELSNICNNHDAIKLANMKGSAGTAASGVVTADCTRHDMKRPCSIGDLQKGERHVNVDYILNSTLLRNAPKRIKGSYDVACNHERNVDDRFEVYGFTTLGLHDVQWFIPKFHLPAHRDFCRANYSFNLGRHVGRTDGEAVERGWASSNPYASSTKEMGPGSRRDLLDDVFGDHNWRKVTQLPVTLLAKIKEAVELRNEHVSAFRSFHATLPLDDTAEWLRIIEEWEEDRSRPNPFEIKHSTLTLAAIRLKLAEEDAEALRTGEAHVVHEEFTASGMLVAGIELEEQQRRLRVDAAALGQHATDLQRAKFMERQNTLLRKLEAWWEIQALYMPGVTAHQQEWRLRYAQAHEVLNDLRGHLELRSHLYVYKDRFVRGQRHNTRARTVITGAQSKIDADVSRYRTAHAALLSLSTILHKTGWQVVLQPLNDSDIRHVTDGEDGQSEGRRTLSWIWKASGEGSVDGRVGEHLQDSLRREWCKARARADRWSEECMLLKEEMRRVLEFHSWQAHWWTTMVNRRIFSQSGYLEGANAYAYRQCAIRTAMREKCEHTWRYVAEWLSVGDLCISTPPLTQD